MNIYKNFVKVEPTVENIGSILKKEYNNFIKVDTVIGDYNEVSVSKKIKLSDFKFILNFPNEKYEGIANLYATYYYDSRDIDIFLHLVVDNGETNGDEIFNIISEYPLITNINEIPDDDKWIIDSVNADIFYKLFRGDFVLELFKHKGKIKKIEL